MKTIKQMADDLKIEKQRVYRFVKRNHISEAHQSNGVMYYDDVAESLIQSHFNKITVSCDAHHEANHTTSHDVLIDAVIQMLQRELEIKNKQIEELTAIIREHAEGINADRKNELAETLIEGNQKLLLEAAVAQSESESLKQRGFLGWFKSKLSS